MKEKHTIWVTKDGPYKVSMDLPLIAERVIEDEKGQAASWKEMITFGLSTYPTQDAYYFCRCGHSKRKPFCDGTHVAKEFNGHEVARKEYFNESAKVFEGVTYGLIDQADFMCQGKFLCGRNRH